MKWLAGLVVIAGAGCGRLAFDDGFSTDGACGVLPMAIRDFLGTAHDFTDAYSIGVVVPGLVRDRLGPDRVPVYGPTVQILSIEGPDSFYEWFHTSPDNLLVTGRDLEATAGPGPSDMMYGSSAFFPIDDAGLPDRTGGHNFQFTVELHAWFVAGPGVHIAVSSDDDSWLFLDQTLAIDLGGNHEAIEGTADPTFEPGTAHELDLFYAERAPSGAVLTLTTQGIDCLRQN